MPTLSTYIKSILANNKGRTDLKEFSKAVSLKQITLTEISLEGNETYTLNLYNSLMIMIIGLEDYLSLTLKNENNELFTIEGTGFMVLNSTNLKQIVIKNNSTELVDVQILY